MTRVFVTATGTDVGKTFVMCRLIAELQAAECRLRVVKPVATGFDVNALEGSDTAILILAQHLTLTPARVDATTPWRFSAPISPNVAAARESRAIPFDDLVAFCTQASDVDVTLIEGVGGVMVPLDTEHTVLDLIERLKPTLLMVAGSYLGSLSHTLTAIGALRSRGIEIAALIISESPGQPMGLIETKETLRRFVPHIPIVALPRFSEDSQSAPSLANFVRANARE